jgi:hypothetical protein
VAAGGRQRSTRDERERARVYQARQAFHRGRFRRRTRDNVLAGTIGGILILGIVGGQIAFYTAGPGGAEPSPSPTESVAPTAPPLPVPTVPETPAPAPSAS